LDNKQQYLELCKQPNDIPLFLKDWWLDAVCDNWEVAIVMNGDKVAGVWPYNTEQKASVSIIRNPVLTPYMGPHIFYPHDLKASKRDNFEYEVTEALYRQMTAKVWSVSLLPGQKQVGLFAANGFKILPRQTFIMPLQEEETAIFSRLHEDYRRNIRKAETELTITNEPALLPELWQYQKATLDKKDVHMHFSQQQIQKVFDACVKNDSAALWVAKKEGVIQAILWHIWDESRAYYLVGSKNPATKDNRAMTALIWKGISESKKMGKTSFDFEGSMDTGVEKFFRNFGGERTLYLSLVKNQSSLWRLKQLLRA
jgi:lipid II:glycine glycyltransferase (peptidoglycan interpeptide bridge formation enzyme)